MAVLDYLSGALQHVKNALGPQYVRFVTYMVMRSARKGDDDARKKWAERLYYAATRYGLTTRDHWTRVCRASELLIDATHISRLAHEMASSAGDANRIQGLVGDINRKAKLIQDTAGRYKADE